jgi:hypothetical protein
LSIHQLCHGRQTQTFEARIGEGAVHRVTFQPHLDQMQHAPINDPARYRF